MNNPKSICKEVDKDYDRKRYPEMDCFMNESASDVVFIVDGQRVPAFKSLLFVKSPVFRAMFSGNFKESKDKEVVIKETTFVAFKTLIRFIYSDQMVLTDGKDLDSIKELVKLSDRYQVYRLIDRIGEHLKSLITLDNLEFICGIAFDYDIKELVKGLKEFIRINFNAIKDKDIAEVNRINEYTHNCFTEVLIEFYRKTENFFRPIAKSTKYTYPNCKHTYQIKSDGHPLTFPIKFDFDKMHEN